MRPAKWAAICQAPGRRMISVQIDLTIEDRFGKPVKPKEWFLVPLQVIDEAVNRIRDGSITDLVDDPETARLVSAAAGA